MKKEATTRLAKNRNTWTLNQRLHKILNVNKRFVRFSPIKKRISKLIILPFSLLSRATILLFIFLRTRITAAVIVPVQLKSAQRELCRFFLSFISFYSPPAVLILFSVLCSFAGALVLCFIYDATKGLISIYERKWYYLLLYYWLYARATLLLLSFIRSF